MKKKHQRGFTLLEVVVSVILISLIGVVIAQSFFTTTKNNTKAEALKEVKQNGDFALSVMERMLHNAAGLNMSCPDTGIATPSVAIKNLDGGTSTLGCALYTQGTTTYTRLASISAEVTYLSTEGISLGGGSVCDASTLRFTCATSSNGTTIDISFQLGKVGSNPQDAQSTLRTFSSTVVLRN